ncbi:hypothetical protein DZK27_09490 [Rhodobacteraceae bacterium 63075]|nr:hypothetical protein DZK27_09490 [Rhodobacteraceae bacterium 63075]
MTRIVLTAAFVLSASMASAMCSKGHEQAMSCGEGQTFDTEKGACVPLISS